MESCFKDLCRVCLEEDPTNSLFPLTCKATRESFVHCTGIQVHVDDEGYPLQLCARCYNKLTMWRSFKSQAIESHRRVRNFLTGGGNVEDPEDPISEAGSAKNDGLWEEFPDTLEDFEQTLDEPDDVSAEADEESPDKKRGKFDHQRQCDYCEAHFDDKRAYEKHLKMHSEERPFKCSYCSYAAKHKRNLVVHEEVHRKKKQKEGDVLAHGRYHSSGKDKRFECDQCDKSFVTRTVLKYHMEVHNDVRPFECDNCRKAFKHKRNLIRHMQSSCHPEKVSSFTEPSGSLIEER